MQSENLQSECSLDHSDHPEKGLTRPFSCRGTSWRDGSEGVAVGRHHGVETMGSPCAFPGRGPRGGHTPDLTCAKSCRDKRNVNSFV